MYQLLKSKSCALPTWWLWRGGCTRSLSEHGRETPLRPWYFVLRRGRVGRCQVCKAQLKSSHNKLYGQKPKQKAAHKAAFRVTIYRGLEQPPPNRRRQCLRGPANKKSGLAQTAHNGAGWSSPVARQAHNLKAAGSNPAPATKSSLSSRNTETSYRWREDFIFAGDGSSSSCGP